jgi:hypothetical protein
MLEKILFLIFLFSSSAYARSLRATADRLGREVTKIGLSLALVGLAIGAIFLVLGKQDAANKLTATVLGIIVLVVGKSIVSFIQNIA